ncbi:hypothetical protein AAHN97_01105 [Chitinophaga niabensis]|uniref:hypothetical protein n=1 Tax=Chitinophaga niabensis TaxID=536979 RepID=UPI0031BA2F40
MLQVSKSSLLILLITFSFVPLHAQTLQSVTDGGGNISARNGENIVFKNVTTGQANYLRWYEANDLAMGYIGYGSASNRWFHIDNSQNNPVRIWPRLIVGLNTDDTATGLQVANNIKISGQFPSMQLTNGKNWDISSHLNGLAFNETGIQTGLYLKDGGNVGIGTLNPQSRLQIGEFTSNNANKLVIPGVYNFETVNLGQGGNGSAMLEFINHSGVSTSYGVKIGANVDTYGNGLYIVAAPSSNSYNTLQYAGNPAIFVNTDNQVAIGTTNPAGYKLAVAGNMIAEKIKVKLQTGWPDYVFDESYVLPTLQEVAAFAAKNKHLPGIPTAEEVKANGLDLGETDKKLLQKIEELTLYLIGQDKQLSSQQQMILQQQKLVQALEKRVKELEK